MILEMLVLVWLYLSPQASCNFFFFFTKRPTFMKTAAYSRFLCSFFFFWSDELSLSLAVIPLISPFSCRERLRAVSREPAQPLSAAAWNKKLFSACHRFTQTSHLKVKPVRSGWKEQEWIWAFPSEIWPPGALFHLLVLHFSFLKFQQKNKNKNKWRCERTSRAGNASGSFVRLTPCSISVSSRRRLRHLAAASLFLSRLTLLFSSSSGLSWGQERKTNQMSGRGQEGEQH